MNAADSVVPFRPRTSNTIPANEGHLIMGLISILKETMGKFRDHGKIFIRNP